MSSTSPKLDSLPVEILQRIASYGPCESALALLRVSKAFHGACNNRHVFKSILIDCNGFGGPPWRSIPLSAESPTSSWARYAFADSKAKQLLTNQPLYRHGDSEALDDQAAESTDSGRRLGRSASELLALSQKAVNSSRDQSKMILYSNLTFLCWMPQLMASSRKAPIGSFFVQVLADPSVMIDLIVDTANTWLLFMAFQAIRHDDSEDTYALAICLTLRLLSKKSADEMSSEFYFPPNHHLLWAAARAKLSGNLNNYLDGAAGLTATSVLATRKDISETNAS